jgi:hypothetical protein
MEIVFNEKEAMVISFLMRHEISAYNIQAHNESEYNGMKLAEIIFYIFKPFTYEIKCLKHNYGRGIKFYIKWALAYKNRVASMLKKLKASSPHLERLKIIR